jgi:tRNA-Thr(GGU) m(6)t(6)A37 methyltransferase TsaA
MSPSPHRLRLRPVGEVANDFDLDTPIDTMLASESRIVLDPELEIGLEGLELGARILVVFWFHRSSGYDLLQHPRGDRARRKRGVFTLRSPHRPNPVGISEVEVTAIERNVLTVRGLDAVDGTPVLDLKPVPFDRHESPDP